MAVDVGYFGALVHGIASFRLRAYIPSRYLNLNFAFGMPGDVNWYSDYSKSVDKLRRYTNNKKIVFDIVNNHFDGEFGKFKKQTCQEVETITCSSKPLQELILERTGRTALVIPDVYETPEFEPSIQGKNVVWFGHTANILSLSPYLSLPNLTIVSKNLDRKKYNYIEWSLNSELKEIRNSNVVLLTTTNIHCSPNRIIKSLRAGKFVVTPNTNVNEWNEYRNFIWQGDVAEGIAWANSNKEEAIAKIKMGQDYIRDRFNPRIVAEMWKKVFIDTKKI